LYEWEHITERFEKATHYAEKALLKVLVHDIIPVVAEQLRVLFLFSLIQFWSCLLCLCFKQEIDRKRKLEEAIVHRKRSSRIAIKESEKEEARAIARKKAEEEAQMSRARRLQARQEKEEADRLRRESAREERRKEREEKEMKQAQKQESEEKFVCSYLVSRTRHWCV
jgi:flagellar biosynthesis GTPase FlhF